MSPVSFGGRGSRGSRLGICRQFLEPVRKSEVRDCFVIDTASREDRDSRPAAEENRFQGDALALPAIASQFKIAFHSSR